MTRTQTMTQTATITATATTLKRSSLTPQKTISSPSSATTACPTLLTDRTENHSDFSWSQTDEPHATRRRIILAKHPEIQDLFGVEPLTFPIVVMIGITQLLLAYYLRESSWLLIFVVGWAIGGTANHSLQLANHELSHNLCFNTPIFNRFLGMGANLVTGFPSSVTFQKYHMDHHQYQGHDGMDTDIPTMAEVQIFQGPIMKCLWIICQPIFYAVRPTIVQPKPYGKWEVLNVVIQISFNFLVGYFFGIKSLSYLIIGTILGLGLHPAAGHFIAEHYEFMLGQETYSYYGSANYFNFNVGYHNEHHDFPRIPWSRLPLVTKMAPEFYLALPHYNSYIKVFLAYISDSNVGPFARIKRKLETKAAGSDKVNGGVSKPKGKFENLTVALVLIGWFIAAIAYVIYHIAL